MIKDNYTIIEKIGEGSFGTVYLAKDKEENCYAAKVEIKQRNQNKDHKCEHKQNNKNDIDDDNNECKQCQEEEKQNSRLLEEHKIYNILYSRGMRSGIPKIYSLIQTPSFNILVMELLGESLDSIFVRCGKKFNLGTVLKLGYDIINLLEKLHKVGFIHRDIKPNNFLIGKNKNIGTIYLTDFGLSRNYIKNGKHISFKSNKNLIGTLRYASINMHLGMEPSRRDDLESVGYMLIYFLKGVLPWQGIKRKTEEEHFIEIGDRKIITNLDKLCSDLPKQFKEYIKICRELRFDQKPDYELLKNLFLTSAKENKIDMRYEWIDKIELLNN